MTSATKSDTPIAHSGTAGLASADKRPRKGRPPELSEDDKDYLSVRIPRDAREDFRTIAVNSNAKLSALYRDILVAFLNKAPYRQAGFAFVPSHKSGPLSVQSLFRVGRALRERIESEAAAQHVSVASFVTTALEWARSALRQPRNRN